MRNSGDGDEEIEAEYAAIPWMERGHILLHELALCIQEMPPGMQQALAYQHLQAVHLLITQFGTAH